MFFLRVRAGTVKQKSLDARVDGLVLVEIRTESSLGSVPKSKSVPGCPWMLLDVPGCCRMFLLTLSTFLLLLILFVCIIIMTLSPFVSS